MHIHILGICGTFMGGLATLARGLGHKVTGSDLNVYPPMSTMLQEQGIDIIQGFDVTQLKPQPDVVVIGNALSRGNPAVEYVLNNNIPYTSGPHWLAEYVLQQRWVLAVAGTHGKTTTSSMLAWILQANGMKPGFLIGGVAKNFGASASLGDSDFFVIEADEYDTAFFDKRSKFVHYHPRTVILNNLEFDHADIFSDLAAIQTQFHHLIRTVPSNGLIVMPKEDVALQEVIEAGCWTSIQTSGDNATLHDWAFQLVKKDGSVFQVTFRNHTVAEVQWRLKGLHNVKNGLHAIAAAVHCGVPPEVAVSALCEFKGVKRRLTPLGTVNEIALYDDFAHHPTAIATTLAGMRQSLPPNRRLIAVFEPRSNTMRMGMHRQTLPEAFKEADHVFAMIDPNWGWSLAEDVFTVPVEVLNDYDALVDKLLTALQPGDEVVFMSNGSFGGVPEKVKTALENMTE